MIKELFNLNYHHKLTENLAGNSIFASISANLVAVFLFAYTLYDVVPSYYLLVYMVVNIMFFLIRKHSSEKFLSIKTAEYDVEYIKIILSLVFFNALSYQIMIFLGMIYGIDDIHLLVLILVVVALVAGSINVNASVLIVFLTYLTTHLSVLIAVLLYINASAYALLIFVIAVFFVIYLLGAYKYYTVISNNMSLEETFKTLYDKSSDGIILIKNKRFIDCNDSALKMFKYDTKEEFLNVELKNLSPKYQPDNVLSTRKIMKKIFQTKKNIPNSFEWIQKDKSNQEFWCEIILTKITLKGNDLIYGVWRNISDRKTLELKQKEAKKEIKEFNATLLQRVEEEVENNRRKDKQLLEQSKFAQMGEMISMIAHQWRQPLATISATAMTMELKLHLDKVDKNNMLDYLKNISKQSQHLSLTIDDFRNFFKSDKKKKETTYKDIITSVLSIVAQSIEHKNVKIVTNLNSQDVFLTFDNEIKQVILNLLKNAEDALLDKEITDPQIVIETDGNEITIKDNAGGIPEDIIGKVFDPYFSTKLDKNGTGLGLYMSKTIVQEHCNGRISVENDEDGAVFKISLTPK